MPELPEVETVVRTLESMILHAKIEQIHIYYEKTVVNPEIFKQKLTKKSFTKFSRRGKYALFTLEDVVLMVHLRMEGRFYVFKEKTNPSKHTHVVFEFCDGRQLHYHDTRKFGRMECLEENQVEHRLAHLGKEPNEVSYMDLMNKAKGKSVRLKAFLLDQSNVAGIGNIYADEVIFKMNAHPATRVSEINEQDFKQMAKAIHQVIAAAIEAGGTTIRSYTSSLDVSGRFQLELCVHMQENQPCQNCSTPIIKIKCCGRGTYLCPNCQRVKE